MTMKIPINSAKYLRICESTKRIIKPIFKEAVGCFSESEGSINELQGYQDKQARLLWHKMKAGRYKKNPDNLYRGF